MNDFDDIEFQRLHMCNFNDIKPLVPNRFMSEMQSIGRALRKKVFDHDTTATCTYPTGKSVLSFEDTLNEIHKTAIRDYVQRTARETMSDDSMPLTLRFIKPRKNQFGEADMYLNTIADYLTLDQIKF